MSVKVNSVLVTLYAPSIDKTVERFELQPYTTYPAVLQSIRAALGDIPQAWPYTTKHVPVEDFETVNEGQTLLVAIDYFEQPLASSIKDILVVQPGAAENAWMALQPVQKYTHVKYLRHSSFLFPPTYLTLSQAAMQPLTTNNPTCTPSLKFALQAMQENWNLSIDAILGLQGLVMPYGELEDWDEKLVPALGMLSAATVTQGCVVSGLIIGAVRNRGGKVVEVDDITGLCQELYRSAMEGRTK